MKIINKVNRKIYGLLNRKEKKKIFFLHIPKCGGTSIDEAIQNSFGPLEKENLFHLDAIASSKGSEIAGDEIMDFREKILTYYMSIGDYKYISGHFKYNQKVFEEFGKEWHYITLLRHPVSKWFSQYFYNRYKTINDHFRINSNIEDFLESERGISYGCDYITRFVDSSVKIDVKSDDAVDEALNNLNNFSLVGVLEDMDTFVKDYPNLFGAKILIPHQNSNPLSKEKQQEIVTDKIKQKIEEICQPNMKVYESVLKKIKAQC